MFDWLSRFVCGCGNRDRAMGGSLWSHLKLLSGTVAWKRERKVPLLNAVEVELVFAGFEEENSVVVESVYERLAVFSSYSILRSKGS